MGPVRFLPGGRPDWEAAGARFVDDVGPFEQRKLWLLNGSHSLLAYAGSSLGHETVADAIADPEVRAWVEEWWDAASAHLSLPADEVRDYRSALLARYRNPSIRHLLAQIAADGSQKIPDPGRSGGPGGARGGPGEPGCVASRGGLDRSPAGAGAPVTDAHADEVVPLGEGTLDEAARRTLEWLAIDAGPHTEAVLEEVTRLVEGLEARRSS